VEDGSHPLDVPHKKFHGMKVYDVRELDLVKKHANGNVVTYNPILTALVGCNTACYFLGSAEQAKAAFFYCVKYINKNGVALAATASAFLAALNAVQFTKKRHVNQLAAAATADTAALAEGGAAADVAATVPELDLPKTVCNMMLNQMHGAIEVGAQQAASVLMGFHPTVCTHSFFKLFPNSALQLVKEAYARLSKDLSGNSESPETTASRPTKLAGDYGIGSSGSANYSPSNFGFSGFNPLQSSSSSFSSSSSSSSSSSTSSSSSYSAGSRKHSLDDGGVLGKGPIDCDHYFGFTGEEGVDAHNEDVTVREYCSAYIDDGSLTMPEFGDGPSSNDRLSQTLLREAAARSQMHQLGYLEEDDGGYVDAVDDGYGDAVVNENGVLIGIVTQATHYAFRGPGLEHMNLYEFASLISVIPKKKASKKKSKAVPDGVGIDNEAVEGDNNLTTLL
jgi:hypothetical protein